jgi:formylglycine-generating enzyme required for sulfatase activity
MVCIEGGAYVNDSSPVFERVVATYFLDTLEVTVAQFTECVTAGACLTPNATFETCNWFASDRDDHPIHCTRWFQADEYCTWVGKRLPGEWEWEWAARGRDEGRTYPWGAESPTCARAVMDDLAAGGQGCGAAGTALVGSKPAGASRDGVLDLAGNVWERTSDWFDSGQLDRGLRGGGWLASVAGELRSDFRDGVGPSARGRSTGFRCARTP